MAVVASWPPRSSESVWPAGRLLSRYRSRADWTGLDGIGAQNSFGRRQRWKCRYVSSASFRGSKTLHTYGAPSSARFNSLDSLTGSSARLADSAALSHLRGNRPVAFPGGVVGQAGGGVDVSTIGPAPIPSMHVRRHPPVGGRPQPRSGSMPARRRSAASRSARRRSSLSRCSACSARWRS